MPESKVRKEAKTKQRSKKREELAEQRAEKKLVTSTGRSWVPWVFVPLGLLGVAWMVVYNLAGSQIGFMQSLGDWNVAIGLGLMVASIGLMTLWK